jgi:hypothetical protein
MTSQLLNWYEEGAWTPTVTAQTGTLTTVSSSGKYIRIGKLVYTEFTITITNAGTGSAALIVSNLPFVPFGTFSAAGRSNTNKSTIWTFWGSSAAATLYYDGTTTISSGQVIQTSLSYST